VKLVYGEPEGGDDAPLISIDFSEALLDDRGKQWLKCKAPTRLVQHYAAAWETDRIKVLIEKKELDFDADFYVPYGKPVNRQRALKAWENLSYVKRAAVVGRLKGYLWHLSHNTWKSKADPETYIKKAMYETNWYQA